MWEGLLWEVLKWTRCILCIVKNSYRAAPPTVPRSLLKDAEITMHSEEFLSSSTSHSTPFFSPTTPHHCTQHLPRLNLHLPKVFHLHRPLVLLADSLTLDDGGAFADDINFNCQDGIISDLLLDDDDGLSTLPPSLPLDKINHQ